MISKKISFCMIVNHIYYFGFFNNSFIGSAASSSRITAFINYHCNLSIYISNNGSFYRN